MNNEKNKLALSGAEGIVPQLRFPEFEKDKEWQKKPFSKLFKIGSGRDYKHLDKGEIPVYGTGGYMLSVNNYLYDGKSACIGRKGTINKPIFLTGKFWTVDTLFYTHSFKDCSPEFIYLLFQNINWLNYNEAGGVPSLSKVIIYKIEVYVPKPEEQEKIIKVISSLDNLITAETEKLDLLKDHKKGLLQKLFPAEGKTQPQFRFPEFKDDGEWEETILGDDNFAIIIMGSSPKSSSYNENKIGLPLLQGNADIKNRKSKPRIYTSEITKKCKIDDILLSVRAPVGTVAKSLHNACIGRGISAIRVLNENSQEFLYQWLISFEPYWQNISQGGTFDSVNSKDIKSLKIHLPSNPKEQQKIAACLSSVDKLIDTQTQKIEQLQEHKKGLVQQLFPTINDLAV